MSRINRYVIPQMYILFGFVMVLQLDGLYNPALAEFAKYVAASLLIIGSIWLLTLVVKDFLRAFDDSLNKEREEGKE
ncbi:hypothetical protein ABC345_02805 [Shouchella sp. 1P09AA]|uniref:hypothetical protein n=1 Tax=unclassified Shouchella TaxID=2893065 RepID=UPI00399F9693